MDNKKVLSLFLGLISLGAMAQETAENEVPAKPEIKLSYLDSLKSTFVKYETSACIDEMWMKELSNQDLFTDMESDLAKVNIDQEVAYDLPTDLLKDRLKRLDEKSPFNIEYNQGLENIIKSFLKNRPKAFERMMAISEYYFPMFEEKLAKYNIPLEVKYLAVVESALNPKAKSRVGATGLWQFMYATGKQYNLEVNSYVDERSDPMKATEAACQYLSTMYGIFGDWDLVLASYNTGPGNVAKAIRRSGGLTNYWNIRKFMHKETQGYLPAFLATMYIYEYRKEHGIVPKRAPLTYFETDTLMVKQKMSFKQLSDLLDIPVEQLRLLNPIYKLDVVPYVTDKPHYIRLPKQKAGMFVSNEDKIYAYVQYEEDKREKPFTSTNLRKDAIAQRTTKRDSLAVANVEDFPMKSVKKTRIKYYTVKRGDNLSEISSKNNVTVAELKKWNKLKKNTVNAGQKLKIEFETNVMVADRSAAKKKTAEPKMAEPKIIEPKATENDLYVVQKGDNLTAIAEKNKVTIDQLKEWNNIENSEIKIGQKLTVQAPAEETAAVAVVEKEVKKEIINRDSSKERNYNKERMYVVQKGDSLFSIAKKHPGITVAEIKKWNNIDNENIKPGMKLKING
ncbi:LysM peptidoglycan-binding domain-containing protein [Flavobacterium supellecticarium]|uniref:LysM peptidoglycan-binding domain-containing protein n=1 Tax=Flavobacterium supellecticarium TaxID=2565924 RepID=A0A4S3ZQ78_9FLAO|nr:lytic transglycosylase domain-containing protein [Flavobacterium supellecticarium]THF47688.1 LysM peptidoglycan-binding domain-containing protein [Flavobacterium supellecticarium]